MVELKLTEVQIKIIQGKICQYCRTKTELKKNGYGLIYCCPKCGAYVGLHKGTNKALGRTANKQLRQLKMQAHNSFDQIWRKKKMSRQAAYSWLSEMLEIPKCYTHIGMFSEKTCIKVIEICQKELKK